MKIVYGCNGEGKGHAARAAALWPELHQSMDVTLWCPETVRSFLLEKCGDIPMRRIPGLHFLLQEHRVDYWGTLNKNARLIGNFRKITNRIADEMKQTGVQGVISDFEPFTAVAATKANIPLLNLNHPAVVRRFLSLYPDAVTAQVIAALMTPPAQKNLICSFYDGDVGPILREEIRNVVPTRGDHILVYVKKSSEYTVKQIISKFPERNFQVFPNPGEDFVSSLADCVCVVAPAGHQLLSEALYLKKPVLAIPQQRQFEQRLNAQMLKASGWGWSTDLENLERDLPVFLDELGNFPHKQDPLHKFLIDDYTGITVAIIRDFFEQEVNRKHISPRVSCDYFSYVPNRIKHLWGLIA